MSGSFCLCTRLILEPAQVGKPRLCVDAPHGLSKALTPEEREWLEKVAEWKTEAMEAIQKLAVEADPLRAKAKARKDYDAFLGPSRDFFGGYELGELLLCFGGRYGMAPSPYGQTPQKQSVPLLGRGRLSGQN